MTTNKPIDLGKASEETKHVGPGPADNPINDKGPFTA